MGKAKGLEGLRLTSKVTDEVGKAAQKNFLLSWSELQNWRRDNEYIKSGYRPVSGSFWGSLMSLGYIHNETVNIYSHLIGSLLFLIFPYFTYNGIYHRYNTASFADILVFSTFFFGVAICFFLSASYHTVLNHSPQVLAVGLQLDLLGIVILMWGSTIPTIYYGFYNEQSLQISYWILVTALSTMCAIATLSPRLRRPALRKLRAAMYSGLGISAIIPVIHGIALYGWDMQSRKMSLGWMAAMATFNFIGAAAYAARVPERWYPGAYDIYGGSHQLLHVMVVFAGVTHMGGLLRAFDFLHAQSMIAGL